MRSRTNKRTSYAIGLTLIGLNVIIGGCISINPWPFGQSNSLERASVPANSIEYGCDGGKKFYARLLEDGAAAWVIFPEREFRLNKSAAESGTSYSNGMTTLHIESAAATLSDGKSISYVGCKKLVNS